MLKQMRFVAAVALLFITTAAYAQFTTSTLTGKVTDANNVEIIGATVQAIHQPSGTFYGAITNIDGLFTIQGMRTGGPYKITVSYVGYQTVEYNDVNLKLGETFALNTQMAEASEQLEEVVVVATRSKFASEKTGASTNVSNAQMMNLPTANRSIQDLTRLSPYANGMSFAGGDGRSTNFTVDGANFNNNFGLSSSLPGGGTPISMDAIEELQMVVAPFDVRQTNFVGGGINAITKSGTNTIKGSAYTYQYNQNFRGNRINHADLGARPDESKKTYGFTLGGPIIKNKLFFFVNYESNKEPGSVIDVHANSGNETVGGNVSRTTVAQMEAVKQRLVNTYGYDPGSYTSFPGGVENTKVLARVDWNINDQHKLSVRYNNTDNTVWKQPNGNSCDDLLRNKSFNRVSTESMAFSNNLYSEGSKVKSISAELNSRFGNKFANQLIFTYTDINDKRGSNSSKFPHIDIMQGPNVADILAGTGTYSDKPAMSMGYELFTWNNGVANEVKNLTDNFTWYAGRHTVTAGASWEYQTANNSYMRNGTGYYRFASIDDFLNGAMPISAAVTYGYDGNDSPAGVVTYNQYGLYVQDDYRITDNFKLNYGIRMDALVFNDDDLMTNNAILDYKMGNRVIDTGHWPDAKLQISPRVGFVWDIKGDNSLKLRGGSGLFMGRLPLVFFTNMPQNSGMIQNNVGNSNLYSMQKNGTFTPEAIANLTALNKGGKVVTDVNEMISILNLPTTISPDQGLMQSTINGVDPDFKMPQIWKTSVALDWNAPTSFPLTVTGELMYSKTFHGVRLIDWNINNDGMTAHFAGVDNRYNYRDCQSTYGKTNAFVLSNTRRGYGYTANITVTAKPVENLDVMAAYTHTVSKEVSGMPGSNATSAYQGIYTIDGPNFGTTQNSRYVVPDKLMLNLGYFIPFSYKNLENGLHVNLFYTGYSPDGYSYIYSNDMNGDGNSADLMYIPKDDSEINFKTSEDRDAFWAFVEQDSYLKNHKGEYAEAYSARSPWIHRFDLRIARDFAFKIGNTKHKFQLSADVMNVGNLINSKWGVTRWSAFTNAEGTYNITPLKYEGVNAQNQPVYSMNKLNGAYPTETWNNYFTDPSECWKITFGLRYYFN